MKKLRENCPNCKNILHKGQHKFNDGLYFIAYCKECGFKNEKPLKEKKYIKHLKEK